MRRMFLVTGLAAVFAGFATGCTQRQRVNIETEIATALVSDEQERQIGRAVHEELERQGARAVRDPVVVAYVESIVRSLLGEVRREGTGPVHVHVLDAPEEVNAFATPGGHVYVFSGLLLAAGDEAEVAGVLAHELGHLVAHHPERRLLWLFGTETLAALALGEEPHVLAQIAASFAQGGLLAANSRADENEADEIAVRLTHRAGWDPRGLVRFFRRVRDLEGDLPGLLAWLSTHPTSTDRIERVRAMLEERGWEGGADGAVEHDEVRRRLRARSDAGSAPS